MTHLNLSTELGAHVTYDRDVPRQRAVLRLTSTVPRKEAAICRDGNVQKTLDKCHAHELEFHQGIFLDVREALFDLLPDVTSDAILPSAHSLDALETAAGERVCLVTGAYLNIDPQTYEDHWTMHRLSAEVADRTIVDLMLAALLQKRRQHLTTVYQRFWSECQS
jgi:hypothetical protein